MLSILASDQSLDIAVAFSSLGDSEHVVVSLSMDFSVRSKIDDSSHRKAFDYSSTDWDSFHNPIRDGPRENLLKLDILVFLLCQLLLIECYTVQIPSFHGMSHCVPDQRFVSL